MKNLFLIGLICLMGVLEAQVELGIDVLANDDFNLLKGKRVGLLTHSAGVNKNGESTIDVLARRKDVNLVALFGPEHGIYGTVEAEKFVKNNKDQKTGLPVYSLYGKTRKPTAGMLKNLDVLVVDLQDVGVRCYTYISCLLYTMESCFEEGVDVIVLDRPNPLGGEIVDGPMMDTRWMSYVGAFLIPHVHGLTIGELAKLGKDSLGYLGAKGKLTVVPMKGWKRSMFWPETGLKWVATSPHIQSFEAVLGYPMTGLGCQKGGFKHGLGSKYAFRMLSHTNKSPEEIKHALERRQIPGVHFNAVDYQDDKMRAQKGVYIEIKDHRRWSPAILNFHLMQLACEWSEKNPFHGLGLNDMVLFNKHVGSDAWWLDITEKGAKINLNKFFLKWKKQCNDFKQWSQQYYLY